MDAVVAVDVREFEPEDVPVMVLLNVAAPVTPSVLDNVVAPVTPKVLESVVAPVTPNVLDNVVAPVTDAVPPTLKLPFRLVAC